MFFMVGVDGTPTMGRTIHRYSEISFWSPDVARTFIVEDDGHRCDLKMLWYLDNLAIEMNRIVLVYTWGGDEFRVLKSLAKEFMLIDNLVFYDMQKYSGGVSLRDTYKEVVYGGPYKRSTMIDASRIYELTERTKIII